MLEALVPIIVAFITNGLTLLGVVISNTKHNNAISNLIEYRIGELEKKQDKHNGLIERMYAVEKSIEVLDERQKVSNHRIEDLEKECDKYGRTKE